MNDFKMPLKAHYLSASCLTGGFLFSKILTIFNDNIRTALYFRQSQFMHNLP